MRPLQVASLVLMIVAAIFTGFGGTRDMMYHDYRLTKMHLWNDGLFLGIVAIFVLLWDINR
jgi:hypothetical protein